jgi:glycosyltransferase involved in cell wall biosynthesis
MKTESADAGKRARRRRPRCVIVVENLPVPFDRRVWQEALALRDAGWSVSVICPRTERYPLAFENIDGIGVYRHSLPLEAKGKLAFLSEYAAALFHETRLLFKVFRERGFDVIQACNPPDLIFLAALPYVLIGKAFVFDHHDVCPELFAAKFNRKGFLHRALLWLERRTIALANMVISTNETFREIAIDRGGKSPEDVVTVYSVPDASRIRRVEPDESLRAGKRLILGYMGIIGVQDGLDHLVRAVDHLVNVRGITDVRTVVVGDGPALASVRALATELGLDEHILFTGYLSGEPLLKTLSAFDIGVIPDPYNEYNDKISMNKVFEYSALGIPFVSYDLSETRRLIGDAGVFAANRTPDGLGDAIARLTADDALRTAAGARALALAQERFSWKSEAAKYIDALELAFLASGAGRQAIADEYASAIRLRLGSRPGTLAPVALRMPIAGPAELPRGG